MGTKTSDDLMEELEAFVDTIGELHRIPNSDQNRLLALVERIQYLAMDEGRVNGLEEAMSDIPYGGCP